MGVSASNSNTLCCHHQACISDEEEGNTDAEDADEIEAADTNDYADDDDAAPDHDNYSIMPPKVKPPPRKPGTKKTKGESNDVAAMPPPAPKQLLNFSVDSKDKFLISYYCEGLQDYADVGFSCQWSASEDNKEEEDDKDKEEGKDKEDDKDEEDGNGGGGSRGRGRQGGGNAGGRGGGGKHKIIVKQ